MIGDRITRRGLLRLGALAAGCATLKSFASPGSPSQLEQTAMDRCASAFMDEFQIPGFSVTFAHQGQIAYAKGYGFADESKEKPVTPRHLFRIASVSKPITAVAIYTMVEQGKLTLNDLVFGTGAILSRFALPKNGAEWLKGIRVRHLLTHTCGGWQNDGDDPMFKWRELGQEQLIATTLQDQRLLYEPGTHYAYSNFDYCLLGRIIESISGMRYEEYVDQRVLGLCGVTTMSIGGRKSTPNLAEVSYFGPGDPYLLDPQRMDSHGGWLASPTDLVEFALRVDGLPNPPDILGTSTVADMNTSTAANPNYAKGWSVNSAKNQWHSGGMPGTSSILVKTASGMCWAATANSHPKGVDAPLDNLMWKMARCVSAWRA